MTTNSLKASRSFNNELGAYVRKPLLSAHPPDDRAMTTDLLAAQRFFNNEFGAGVLEPLAPAPAQLSALRHPSTPPTERPTR